MVQNTWHGPLLTSWLRTVVFAAKLRMCWAQNQSGGKHTRQKCGRGKSKVYSNNRKLTGNKPFACSTFFPQSVIFRFLFFPLICSKLQPLRWCIATMIIYWDWASGAKNSRGSLITSARNRQEQKESKAKRGRSSSELQQRMHSNLVPHHRHHPSAPPYHSSCWTCFAVKRARLSSHPWKATLRRIDHSLVTAVINSDKSEPNQKFYVYLSALRFLGGRRCPRHLSLT